jgi:chorismate mutase
MSDPGDPAIAKLRRRIDELDVGLIHLLSERARCAIEIGKVKRKRNLAVYDPEREEEVIRLMLEYNRGPLDAQSVRRLFERIIDESRRIERISAEREQGERR